MVKKIIMGVVLSILIVSMGVGCSSSIVPVDIPITPTSTPSVIPVVEEPTPTPWLPPDLHTAKVYPTPTLTPKNTPTPTKMPTPLLVPTPVRVLEGQPPDSMTWMSPGKVQIGNFHMGARVEWTITVHNGSSEKKTYQLAYRKPDYTAAGFLMAPRDIVQDWVIVADATPVLGGRQTKDIMVVLEMPKEVENSTFVQFTYAGKKFLEQEKSRILEDLINKEITPYIVAKNGGNQDKIRKEATNLASSKLQSSLDSNPTMNLLMYLDTLGSVSLGKVNTDGKYALLDTFREKGYIVDGNVLKDKWEFWLGFMEYIPKDGSSRVVTEIASRWQVSMRQ